jgi:Lrp/AsnC family transcriptional regulator, regulator of ectoine-degradation genes
MRTHTSRQRLDSRDLKILEIIQSNGRISKKALADAIGLSLTPCFHRLQRLERDGFIRGYRGIVDAQRLTSLTWVYTEISLARHRAPDFMLFENAIRQMPEVLECDAVGGGIDYVMKVVARDVASYQRFVEDLLKRDIGVNTYYTYIVTKRIKDSGRIPLRAMLEGAATPEVAAA